MEFHESLARGKYLFIDAPRREHYDQSVTCKHGTICRPLHLPSPDAGSSLDVFRQKTSGSREAPQTRIDPELQEKIERSRYVASNANSTLPGVRDTGADPTGQNRDCDCCIGGAALEKFAVCRGRPSARNAIAKQADIPIAYFEAGHGLSILRN